MLLSIITIAFRNLEGIVKTHASLTYLAQAGDISFEWIVVDGGSSDDTSAFLEGLSGEHRLRFVNEPDNGIYDAMNKGIAMTHGRFALFLNSGGILHADATHFIRRLKAQSDQTMVIGDALLDFGNGDKVKRRAEPGWYIYHSLPASHQTIFFPPSGLNAWHYDLQYKISSDYALTARLYKSSYVFKKLSELMSEFSMGGVSTTNNLELCQDAKKVQRRILHMPGLWTGLPEYLHLRATGKTRTLYGKAQGHSIRDLSGLEMPGGFRDGGAIKVQLWWTVQATLFRWSPQVMYRWRVFLLRMFGAEIGKDVVIRPLIGITYPRRLALGDYTQVGDNAVLYTLGDITIDAHTVISQKSYLYTESRDYANQHFDINTTPIVIDAKCWLTIDVFVTPGVTIGGGAAVGAQSSVFRSLPVNVICRGSPAVVTHKRVEKVTP